MRSAIGENMSLFCLGFGNDVDYSFLDVMSRQNKGLARRIFEASDASLQLQVEDLGYKYRTEIFFVNFNLDNANYFILTLYRALIEILQFQP